MDSKKTCVACNTKKYNLDYSSQKDMPEWMKKTGKKNIVPLENMPKMSNLHKIEINVPQLKNKMIYFWATESKNIKKNSGTLKKCEPKCNPDYAYGNYCNSGVTKLNRNGKATVYVETPISYLTEGEKYRPHVHFSTYNEKTKKWNNEMYTLDI